MVIESLDMITPIDNFGREIHKIRLKSVFFRKTIDAVGLRCSQHRGVLRRKNAPEKSPATF
jgi:hypothetical protein